MRVKKKSTPRIPEKLKGLERVFKPLDRILDNYKQDYIINLIKGMTLPYTKLRKMSPVEDKEL